MDDHIIIPRFRKKKSKSNFKFSTLGSHLKVISSVFVLAVFVTSIAAGVIYTQQGFNILRSHASTAEFCQYVTGSYSTRSGLDYCDTETTYQVYCYLNPNDSTEFSGLNLMCDLPANLQEYCHQKCVDIYSSSPTTQCPDGQTSFNLACYPLCPSGSTDCSWIPNANATGSGEYACVGSGGDLFSCPAPYPEDPTCLDGCYGELFGIVQCWNRSGCSCSGIERTCRQNPDGIYFWDDGEYPGCERWAESEANGDCADYSGGEVSVGDGESIKTEDVDNTCTWCAGTDQCQNEGGTPVISSYCGDAGIFGQATNCCIAATGGGGDTGPGKSCNWEFIPDGCVTEGKTLPKWPPGTCQGGGKSGQDCRYDSDCADGACDSTKGECNCKISASNQCCQGLSVNHPVNYACVCPDDLQTPTPAPKVSGQCFDIRMYGPDWSVLDGRGLASLKPGDTVYFTVRADAEGGKIDRARFFINGVKNVATKKEKVDNVWTYYTEYVLPGGRSADLTLNVKVEVHHTVLGWF